MRDQFRVERRCDRGQFLNSRMSCLLRLASDCGAEEGQMKMGEPNTYTPQKREGMGQHEKSWILPLGKCLATHERGSRPTDTITLALR